ncbi:MAG: GNAT family N-acetyltransferase [Alphaproteobacteria bacterium]|nr:GNAT family N-acetyltransferase [Alphaproteobacteria bacterium]
MTIRIVPVSPDHVAEITAIYAKAVHETLVTWDETAPDEAAMAAKLQAIQSAGYPCLVAVCEKTGAIAGYALAGAFHPQSGFRYSAENSIYVADHARRQGLGRRLLDALIQECEARGFRQMIAGISRPGGEASLALHEAAGFKVCGVLPGVGWKMGQWLDAMYLVRPLGDGSSTDPE